MLEKLYLFTVGLCALVETLKPIYGICFLTFLFFTMPQQFYPDIIAYHPNIVLSLILLFSTFLRRIDLRKKWFIIIGIFYVIACVITGLIRIPGKERGYFAIDYFKGVVFISILVSYINNRKDVIFLLKTCLLGGLCNGAYAAYQQILAGFSDFRSFGFRVDPNYLAALLVPLVSVAYYFFLQGENKFLRRLYIVTIGFLVAGILFSVSRAGLLGLLLVGFWISMRNIKKMSTIAVLGIVLIIFFSFAKDLYEQRGETIQTSKSGKTSIDVSGRWFIYKSAVRLWFRYPILGVGTGKFTETARKELRVPLHHIAHSAFLEILVEQGILGFLFFTGLIAYAFRDLARLAKHKDVFFRELAWYLRIGLLGFIFCSATVSIQNLFPLWIYFALPVVLEKVSQNEPGYYK